MSAPPDAAGPDPIEPTPESAAESAAAAEGSATQQAWLSVFLSTATTVFLAELGDKTQLAALLLSAQSGRPVVVFIGASLALVCSSLVGVLLGRWLSSLMAPQQLERGAGLLMVALGLWLGRQAVLQLAPSLLPLSQG
ncbi:MAG: TMEM165/GDT1 family protein [Synechococcaceae cyanobacterium]|nr:TMEM165/GDT1 family protein [Synechococcaceae cyanobacterium]